MADPRDIIAAWLRDIYAHPEHEAELIIFALERAGFVINPKR